MKGSRDACRLLARRDEDSSSCLKAAHFVLLQLEMEKRHVRVILELGRSFSDAKAPKELHAP
jgi:hypothetical protein